MKGPIATAWASYLHNVVPSGAGETQRLETRLAFYAGAVSLFDSIMRSLSPGQEAEDADVEMMQVIGDELKEFQAECDARAKGPKR